MNDIFEKLKTDFQYITGFIYKGLVASMGVGFASRLAEFTSKLNFIEKQAFVSTADKDYLYLNTGRLLPPNASETATGDVVFYGEVGTVIPQGTEIKDDNGTFKTSLEAEIAEVSLVGTVTVDSGTATMDYVGHGATNTKADMNGEIKSITVVNSDTFQFVADGLQTGDSVEVKISKAQVNVASTTAGEIGNRILNDILKIKTTIDGVNSEVGVLEIVGGVDDENIEDYRKRVICFLSNPQAPFSKLNIIAINKDRLKSLKYIWVKGGEIIDGTVKVIAMNYDYGLTTLEADEISKNTIAIAPANFDTASITVYNPNALGVEVLIQDLIPVSEGLQTEIRKNIEYFFENDFYEKEITKSSLEATIYKTKNGAEEVESFTLKSGWKDAQENTFWKLENVVF